MLIEFSWIQILSLSDGERITSIIPVSEFEREQYLMMLTMKGYIKKISLDFFSSIRSTGIIAIQLVCALLFCLKILVWCHLVPIYIHNWQVPGDELKWVRHCTNDDFVAMASQNGMVIMCPCRNVSQFFFLPSPHFPL